MTAARTTYITLSMRRGGGEDRADGAPAVDQDGQPDDGADAGDGADADGQTW